MLATSNVSTFVNNDVSPGAVVQASDHNTQGALLAAVINGDIDNANIASDAAIDGSKLADGSVTTAKIGAAAVEEDKIHASAITLGYAEVTSNQGSITTETDLTSLSVTFTAPSNSRRVEVVVDLHLFSTVAGDTYTVALKESTTTLQSAQNRFQAANQQQHECLHYSVVPSAGSHTYKVSLTRATGTGTLSTFQASTRPAFILVKAL